MVAWLACPDVEHFKHSIFWKIWQYFWRVIGNYIHSSKGAGVYPKASHNDSIPKNESASSNNSFLHQKWNKS